MLKNPLLLFLALTAASGMANADTVLVSVSGQFSGSDVADVPLVAPNGLFSLSFAVDTDPTPLAGSVTGLSFDVPVEDFSYTLNGTAESVTPSEITFFTEPDGGLFQVTVGTGLSADVFAFEGDQAFSGTTSAPTFATGEYNVDNWTYSDPANYDFETPSLSTVSISPTPEPSTVLLIPGGLLALMGRKFRKR